MTKEQFIEKWLIARRTTYQYLPKEENLESKLMGQEQEFISDLNSLFNLRTEEEVRGRLTEYIELNDALLDRSIKELKWFLKEGS